MIWAVASDAAEAGATADRALVVAVIAAVAAIVGALIQVGIAVYNRAKNSADRRRDFAVRQLSEFYSPIHLYRQMSQHLRERVGPIDGEWRLVDHIVETKADPGRAPLVEEILGINDEISNLLLSKAGLATEHPLPDVFHEFLAHSRLLRMSWSEGRNQTESERMPFPAVDAHIEDAIESLRDLLDR